MFHHTVFRGEFRNTLSSIIDESVLSLMHTYLAIINCTSPIVAYVGYSV